jgi:hypothetical protein
MPLKRRHFEFIAELVRALPADTLLSPSQRAQVARAFCNRLALTNPKFDKARFLRACGVDPQ